MTDGEKRRCPWCWEWIDRSATRCEHCKKDVRPTGQRQAAPQLATTSGEQAAVGEPGAESSAAPTGAEALPDLGTAIGQIMWWGTALLLYGVLLFGVAVVYPAPRGAIAVVLLIAQLGAAYLINRALWTRLKSRPISQVARTMAILAVTVVVLIALGWVRRQFLA